MQDAILVKQNNQEPLAIRRGRPRKEAADSKHSSVRIRPGLQVQLAEVAAQTGQSIAAEVEQRIAASFAATPMREPTRELLEEIAQAIGEIDITARQLEGVKGWEDSLITWAMVRETLGNGPITHYIPHPPGSSATVLTEANARLRELEDERRTLEKGLRAWRLNATAPDEPKLGGNRLHFPHPDRTELREAIEERGDIPADFKTLIAEQIDRLEKLDTEIDARRQELRELSAPYYEARDAARRFYHEGRGLPDLPTWLTAPLGMDEPPPRRLFAASKP